MPTSHDDFLVSEELLDCHGRVSHRLTLGVDGTVLLTMCDTGVAVLIDPARRVVLTPGVTVPPALLDAAASLRAG